MPADLSSSTADLPDASLTSHDSAWQELETVLDALSQFGRSRPTPEQFYARLVDRTVQALSALGGAAWLRGANGRMQLVAQRDWPAPALAADEAFRRAHETLLADTALRGGTSATTIQQAAVLVGAVPASLPPAEGSESPALARAVIVMAQRAGASPSVSDGQERLLAAVCEIASEYETLRELGTLRENQHYHREILQFAWRIHRCRRLRDLAYTVAHEGRNLVGCDRLSVAEVRRRGCRLVAVSGVRHVERRSRAARQLEQLAQVARRFDEPFFYADGTCDALPDIVDQLEAYVDQSHARHVAIVPVKLLPEQPDELDAKSGRRRAQAEQPIAVLIAEQFDARSDDLLQDRVMETAQVSATAFWQAMRWERLPLARLLEPLGNVRQLVGMAPLAKLCAVISLVAGLTAALLFVQTDYTIEAPGQLEATVRSELFAPHDALVDEVLVAHGAHVSAGDVLLRLRDPALELELKRITGEWKTAVKQLEAVEAARAGRVAGDQSPLETLRLSSEQQQLDEKLANLQRQIELLNEQRQQLTVHSPLDGYVLTWDVDHLLIARPVQRGQVLLSVADLSAPWQVRLDVADDRVGSVLAAQSTETQELPVRFRFAFDDGPPHTGHVTSVAMLAEVAESNGAPPAPTIAVTVAPDELQLDASAQADLRPGVSVRAEILCGRRSLGYVWLHDIWNRVVEWTTF